MSDAKVNDGGPAFPAVKTTIERVQGHGYEAVTVVDPGMSLRDYFAAKAMQAMLSCYKDTLLGDRSDGNDFDYSTFNRETAIDMNEGCKEIAQDAYAFADAMLKARHQ